MAAFCLTDAQHEQMQRGRAVATEGSVRTYEGASEIQRTIIARALIGRSTSS